MLLAIDVGNTQTVIGLFDLDVSEGHGEIAAGRSGADLVRHWRVATAPFSTADELALQFTNLLSLDGLSSQDVTGVAVSSVVPSLRAALRELTETRWKVPSVIIGPGVRTGMAILYDNPKEVGADRIADAVAAFARYGGPTIVIDFGTATTFEVVSERGEYLGGVILPGIEISLDALFSQAALLPRVELTAPRNVLGKNTVESIQSGAIYGFSSQVEGLCKKLEEQVGPCTVVATGGLGGVISPFTDAIDHYEPWLTLEGLRLIYLRNHTGWT